MKITLSVGSGKRAVATDAGTSASASSGAQDFDHPIFNKRSTFFDLPYWKVNSNLKLSYFRS